MWHAFSGRVGRILTATEPTGERTMTDQRTMTNQQILAVCRSNWEYRGLDDTSVREMLDELSAHLEDAVAAGRTPQDVVGDDVKKFAASWARAVLRSPTGCCARRRWSAS
ncbi:hypothetical protein ACR6C2_17410 [Streptomyces sp. INA 01156]